MTESDATPIKRDPYVKMDTEIKKDRDITLVRDIWIYGDLRNQSLFDTSLNVLCGAGNLAESMKSERVFVIVIPVSFSKNISCSNSMSSLSHISYADSVPIDKAIDQALDYGADRVLLLNAKISGESVCENSIGYHETSSSLISGVKTEPSSTPQPCSPSIQTRSSFNPVPASIPPHLMPEAISKILANVVQKRNPALFLFPLNNILREISARCAFICHSGMIADCQRFKYEKGEIVAVCPSHAGEIMAELGFSDLLKTGFITVQPNVFKKQLVKKELEDSKSEGENFQGDKRSWPDLAAPDHEKQICFHGKEKRVEEAIVSIESEPESEVLVKRLFVKKDKSEKQSLESADKVVAGGAGLGNIEGFRQLRRLAAALGAQIGATRPPVLWHWTDDDRLIGQTGKSISPELLITVGTSGAVQYTAGITDSKTIVAINKDPNAPIFRFADIGIVEDAAVFVPALTEKVQKIALRSLADSLDRDGKNNSNSGTDSTGAGEMDYEEADASAKGADFGSKLMQMRK
ncbi:MAG: electron transfer flavoprotein subunit alpha/FixB family protein, partial [Desulfamplus sp.]|nr:electron transfer flavoprotein subunit alpha/FixB family protein [Desulfamplus sp.]